MIKKLLIPAVVAVLSIASCASNGNKGAAQEPQVAGGKTVVIIQIQGQQRADVESENSAIIDALRQQHRV